MQPQSTGKCEAGGPVDAVYMLSKGGLLAQPNAHAAYTGPLALLDGPGDVGPAN